MTGWRKRQIFERENMQIGKSMTLEEWQKQQIAVATGVTSPEHSTTYISLIEELETENRMLRSRNERLTKAMKQLERIVQENIR
jgi:hypothetical protein